MIAPPAPTRHAAASAALLALLLAGCAKEARTLASDQPQTPPNGPGDPRAPRYEDNVYQVAQGSRYFTWYGCGGCHASDATGVRALGDGVWRHGNTPNRVYAFIAHGHSGASGDYGARIPVEQLWQITAFTRSLDKQDPARTRRGELDMKGEPQGDRWSGPVR